ncbi:hypothetical protein ACFQ3Z_07615 [Streptomyces nogalater]
MTADALPEITSKDPVLVVATLGTGLMAGLYLAFDVGVMPVLARREDEIRRRDAPGQ